ncbi:MAG: LamG-like jellyroll fold domain-containing protein, partial [Planctomycetota bacterium]
MSKKSFFLMAFVVVLSMFSASSFATDYHIDPVSGSDSTGDGSFGNPWETFANVISYYNSSYRPPGWVDIQAGDTVYLMNGTHNTVVHPGDGSGPNGGGSYIIYFSHEYGTSGNLIRILAYPGHSPVVDIEYNGNAVYIINCSYTEIGGFEIKNGYGYGIRIPESDNITVHDMHIHDTNGANANNVCGLEVMNSHDIEVYDSVFNDNYDRTGEGPIENSTAMVCFNSWSNGGNVTVHDCEFYQTLPMSGISGCGLKYKHASEDPNAFFHVYNNTFRNNKIFSFASGTANTHFHHNLINTGGSMRSKNQGGNTHQTNQLFEYNTVYKSNAFYFVPFIDDRNPDFPNDPTNVVFQHNITYHNAASYSIFNGMVDVGTYITDALYDICVDALTFSHNCYYNPNIACKFNFAAGGYASEGGSFTFSGWQTEYGYDTDSVEADPLFVDPNNDDFHLQGGSPADGMGMYAGIGPQPPGQAYNPSPADTATDVSVTEDLSWSGGSGATSSDVYFGTDSTPDAGEFQGNQTATTFDPGTMANDTTYYWRIDEINAEGTTTGNVWSFTTESVPTPPGQASNPGPADSATDVVITVDLSWTAGSGATSHDVYFGTDSTPDAGEFQGNQTATTYDPGTMSYNTTYYWRIDEVNAAGTTTGAVWSFTTESAPSPPGQASSPSPADSATDVSVAADLSWTAGSGATSHDVYFGTTSPGSFQGNQTETTYDPGTMDYDTTYYWRIDELNAAGTTTGAVWSFTTIAAPVDELVGWWKLDESAGTNAADSSGKGYDGTLVGADWAPTSGKFEGAVSFNNVDFADRVDVPITEMSASAGSISLWGKFPGTRTGIRYFFGHTSIPATGYSDRIQLFMDNDDTQLDLGLGDTHFRHTDIMALSVDTWYHIVLTWEAGNYKVYVDTDVKASGAYTGLNTLGSVASIGNDGRQTPDDGAFYGLLDDVRVYNYKLEQDDVNDLYNAGVTPPGQATNPSPADSATNISITADLSWTAGSGATSHDVYFGTSSPGTFQGNQTATTFDPGTMSNDTTYYWRIDEVNAGGTTAGNVWNFTTIVAAPAQASNPGPADSATNVSITADLSWTAGSGATSHDVYFGTSSPGTFQGNQTATTFDTGTMANDTTYYWRIDEVNVGGTTAGNVWSFTTIVAAPSQATNPSPADSATDVTVDADLSWTAGSGATSRDVYFGTSSPGAFQGNQTATTFDTGTMANDTTYYWRIDEVNIGGTTAGNVWSFTTIVAAPAQASNPSPADSATNVAVDADLSWTAGSGATSHDVYFGTSSPGTFQGNQTAATFDPGTMANDTTYYWRIDEVNVGGTTAGSVWSFTTIVAAPSQATNPNPADSATDVAVDADLSWTAGSGATSHDVYFGTSSPGTFQGNQTATTFDPGTMANDTTYYWRIDEVNAGGTTTSSVWSFTTAEQQPPPSQYECDNWQTLHPEWIFCDDFEDGTAMVREGRYFEHDTDSGDFVITDAVGVDDSKGMRVIWQSSETGAGSFKLAFGRNPSSYMDKGIRNTEDFRDIYYRFYLKMQDGWQGNPRKLSRATIIAASDWSQAMVAHHWGSSGSYYLAVDPVSCVDASSQVICIGYNDVANFEWLGSQTGTTPIFDSNNDDLWHYIEVHVKLNDPGEANGIEECWIDGTLDARRDNLDFVTSYTDYAINAIFVENYWDGGSPQLQERYF